MTLVELLIAVSILAVASTALVGLLRAGASVSSAVNSSMANEWEVETGISRMIQQARVASSVTVPSGTSAGTTFSLVTQPDANNGNATYAVSYALVTLGNGTKELQETDSRYGTSTLIRDVQTFDVHLKGSGTPAVVVMSMTVGTKPTISRTLRITPRNQ